MNYSHSGGYALLRWSKNSHLGHAVGQGADSDYSPCYTGNVDDIALGLDESGSQQPGEVVHSPHVDPEHVVKELHVLRGQEGCPAADRRIVDEDI